MTTFRFSAVLCAALFPVSLAADTISITDAYVRAASPAGQIRRRLHGAGKHRRHR